MGKKSSKQTHCLGLGGQAKNKPEIRHQLNHHMAQLSHWTCVLRYSVLSTQYCFVLGIPNSISTAVSGWAMVWQPEGNGKIQKTESYEPRGKREEMR